MYILDQNMRRMSSKI